MSHIEAVRGWQQRNPDKGRLYNIKARAKRKGVLFDLAENDIRVPSVCPALGIPLSRDYGSSDNHPTVDRIDNNGGYVRGNVVVVSHLANSIKNNLTIEQLRAHADDLRRRADNAERVADFYEGL